MSDLAIHVQDVSLTLQTNVGPVSILKNINLQVKKGESIGLVGPSGSGKSSLLMLLGGLEKATKGQVQVLKRNFNSMGEDGLAKFRRMHMGIIFQSFHLIPTMTALENVATPMELSGKPNALKFAEDILSEVNLEHRLHHYPAQMSGGEQQRTALARAVCIQPDILLADEPTGNLDEHNGGQIIELLFELVTKFGSTLVLVTHDNEIATLCDRLIQLRNGKIFSNLKSLS